MKEYGTTARQDNNNKQQARFKVYWNGLYESTKNIRDPTLHIGISYFGSSKFSFSYSHFLSMLL